MKWNLPFMGEQFMCLCFRLMRQLLDHFIDLVACYIGFCPPPSPHHNTHPVAPFYRRVSSGFSIKHEFPQLHLDFALCRPLDTLQLSIQFH